MRHVVRCLCVTGTAIVVFGQAHQFFAASVTPTVVTGNPKCSGGSSDANAVILDVCGFEPLECFDSHGAVNQTFLGDDGVQVSVTVAGTKKALSWNAQADESQFVTDPPVGAVGIKGTNQMNIYCYNGTGKASDTNLGAPGNSSFSSFVVAIAPGPCLLPPEDVEDICAMGNFEIVRTENIENDPISQCACENRGVTIENCSTPNCTAVGGIGAPNDNIKANKAEFSQGGPGSTCVKKTICYDPPIGGDQVCQTVKICK